jgi:hypothetical protein
VGALLTGVWFVRQHYWFLDIAVGVLHLHTACKLVLAALVPALLVPGLVSSHAPRAATGGLLVFQVRGGAPAPPACCTRLCAAPPAGALPHPPAPAPAAAAARPAKPAPCPRRPSQALAISLLEEQLYVPSHQDLAGEPMYPGYLVIATSALGAAAARKLMVRRRCWIVDGARCRAGRPAQPAVALSSRRPLHGPPRQLPACPDAAPRLRPCRGCRSSPAPPTGCC